MRKIGCALALGAVLLTSDGASPQEPGAFSLPACGLHATDVVVTDADGRVLECWRGELKPGDIVRLGPARLSPANALPWELLRLRPEVNWQDWYGPLPMGEAEVRSHFDNEPMWKRWPDLRPTDCNAPRGLRLVLFLRKDTPTPGLEPVWLPACARATGEYEIGYFGGSERDRRVSQNDFANSVALIEGGRVVALQHRFVYETSFYLREREPVVDLIANTSGEFRESVARLTAIKAQADAARQYTEKEPGAAGTLRTWGDFVNLSLPAFPTRQGTHP